MNAHTQIPGQGEAEKLAPHNEEAERQLLGAILMNNETFYRVAQFLEPEHFFVPAYQDLFEKIGQLIRSGKTASPITLKTFYPADAKIADLSATQFLLRLAGDAASSINAEDYGLMIQDLAVRRELIYLAQTMSDAAYAAAIDAPPSQIIDEIGTQLFDMRPTDPGAKVARETFSDIGEKYLTDLTEVMQGNGVETPMSGLVDLDRHIGGFYPGCTYVLAGRPGMGKSALAVALTLNITRQKRRDDSRFGVVYFSLEVPGQDIWARAVSSTLRKTRDVRIDYSDIRAKRGLTPAQAEHIAVAEQQLRGLPLRVCDRRGISVSQLEARARAIKAEWARKGQSLDVIVVDHIGLMKPSSRNAGNRNAEITEISGGLLELSERLGVAVIELSQLSRKVEERPGCKPQLSDLRDSGSIEQDANTVVFLYRPEYYAQRDGKEADFDDINRLEAIVGKARDGKTGNVDLHCEIGLNFIENRSRNT